MLRFLTAGESHGPALTVIVEGLPSGIRISIADVAHELRRRRLGYGRGPRMALEQDDLELLGGVRHGRTLGSPVAVVIRNTEWYKWQEEMSPGAGEPKRRLTQPRPGHADLIGMQKYGFDDARNILERASARETAARVAAGTLAKALLGALGCTIISHVVQIGPATVETDVLPGPDDLERIDASPVRCADPAAEARMIGAIEKARDDRETLGGVFEVLGYGVPPTLGSHVHWDRKLDGRLAQAVVSIQAVKGAEIGDARLVAGLPGSESHDEIGWTAERGYFRYSHRAGGLEGGITNGELLVVRGFMKPISTLPKGLRTVDVDTKEATSAFFERSDTVAVPAAGVIGETMVALTLAAAVLERFGGDRIEDVRESLDALRHRIGAESTEPSESTGGR